MFLSRALMARNANERIKEYYLRAYPPKTRKPVELGENEADYHEKLFKYFDRDGNNYLDMKELSNLVKYHSKNKLYDCDFTKAFEKMDLNSDNRISLHEYLQHVSNCHRKLPLNKELKELFYSYDKNFDAHISLDEFRQILFYMGEDYSRSDLRQLFVSVDEDKDGLIDVYQFLDLVKTKLR